MNTSGNGDITPGLRSVTARHLAGLVQSIKRMRLPAVDAPADTNNIRASPRRGRFVGCNELV